MNVIIEKIPKEMHIDKKNMTFNVFAEKFINYMEDLEDKEKVENEMKNNSEGFDYNLIRGNYV